MSEMLPESLEARAARDGLRYIPVAGQVLAELSEETGPVFIRVEADPDNDTLATLIVSKTKGDS